MNNWQYGYLGVGGGDQTEIRRKQFGDCEKIFHEIQLQMRNLDKSDRGLEHIGMITLHDHLENLRSYLSYCRNSQINSLAVETGSVMEMEKKGGDKNAE